MVVREDLKQRALERGKLLSVKVCVLDKKEVDAWIITGVHPDCRCHRHISKAQAEGLVDPSATYRGSMARIVGKNAIQMTTAYQYSSASITAHDSVRAAEDSAKAVRLRSPAYWKVKTWPRERDKNAVVFSAGRPSKVTKVSAEEMRELKDEIVGFA